MNSFDVLHSLLARLSLIVMWMWFAVVHLVLFQFGLFALWWLQIPPQKLCAQFLEFVQSLPVLLAGVMGVSVLTILSLWVWMLRKIYAKIAVSYLFKDINEQIKNITL